MFDYIDNTLEYIKATIESFKIGFNTVKEIIISIGTIIGTIVDILGFIGFRVFLLLLITAFIAWVLNLVSPISKKTNYFVAVGVTIWIGITAKLPVQIVITKYIIIIISPFIITYSINFLTKYFFILSKKTVFYFRKFILFLEKKIKKVNLKFKNNSKIGIIFDCDLPSLTEIENCKNIINQLNCESIIFGEEKIGLTDTNGKIIFSNESKVSQFIDSINDKKTNILCFWGNSYRYNSILNAIKKQKVKKQKKVIIGNEYNSQIFNFLQTKWDWQIIYGINAKNFNLIKDINEELFIGRWFKLSLINDFQIEEGFFIKNILVGGNIQCIVNSIGTINQLNFKNKILFLSYNNNSKSEFYKYIIHLAEFIIYNNYIPLAIVIKKIDLGFSYANTIKEFNDILKSNNINIPIFQSNIDIIILNKPHIISYNMGKINLI